MLSTNAWVLLFIFFTNGEAQVIHDHFTEQCQCNTLLQVLKQANPTGVGYCKPGNIKYTLNGKPIILTRFKLVNLVYFSNL